MSGLVTVSVAVAGLLASVAPAWAHTYSTPGPSAYFETTGRSHAGEVYRDPLLRRRTGTNDYEMDWRVSAACATEWAAYLQVRPIGTNGPGSWADYEGVNSTFSATCGGDEWIGHFLVSHVDASEGLDVRLIGWNGSGWDPTIVYLEASTLARGPDAPTRCPGGFGLEASGVEDGKGYAIWRWDAPDGTEPLTYELQRRRAGSSAWETRYVGASRSHRDSTGLGVDYVYRLRASNVVAAGPWCTELAHTGGDSPTGDNAYLDRPHGGDATDDDGASCGFSMFCWIKAALRWAFVPGDSTRDAWESFTTNLRSRPPFSVVSGGVSFGWTFVEHVRDKFGVLRGVTGGGGGTCLPNPTGDLRDELHQSDSAFCVGGTFASLSEHPGVAIFRLVIVWFTYFGITLAVWRILKSGFGTSEARGVERMDDGERDDDDR